MKFNKALLTLAVAGALATPTLVNAKAQVVVNDSTDGLPLTQNTLTTVPGATQVLARGINAPSTSVATSAVMVNDDVTVDAVYVKDNGNKNTAETRKIELEGAMPASGRRDVSVAYSADVTLPDEGTLRFEVSGNAGGFEEATANTLILQAQAVIIPTYSIASAGVPGIQVGAVLTDVTGDGLSADDTVGGVAVGAGAGAVTMNPGGHIPADATFVQVGQSFDYGNTNPADDDDIDYVTFQIDTDNATLDKVQFVKDDNTATLTSWSAATVVWLKTTDADGDGNLATDSAGDQYTLSWTDGVTTTAAITAPSVTDAFVLGEALPRDVQVYVAQPGAAGTYTPANFVVTEGAVVGDTLDVAVTVAKNTAGVDIDAAETASERVVTINNGLALLVKDVQSVIDVEATPARTKFVNNGTTSIAEIKLSNSADYGITLDGSNGADSFSLVLKRKDGENVEGVKSITLGGAALTAEADGSWTYERDFTDADALIAGYQNLTITVEGDEVLYPNATNDEDWVIEFNVFDDGADSGETAGSGDYVITEEEVTHTWTINGLQAKIPYLYNINADSWSSVVKVVNESANAANVSADVILSEIGSNGSIKASAVAEDGTYVADALTDGGHKFTIESLGVVPAKGHITFEGSHIIEALGLDKSVNYHIELTMLVEAPQNEAHVAAQNKSPDGRADAPVLYNINQLEDKNCVAYNIQDNAAGTGAVALVGQAATVTCTSRTVDGRKWQ